MKAYVITTGTVFALIVLAHVWRVVEEGPALARDPGYILLTLLALALFIWSWRVLRLLPRSSR